MHVDFKHSHSVWHSERMNSQNWAVMKCSCFTEKHINMVQTALCDNEKKQHCAGVWWLPHNEALSLIWKHWGFQGCWLPWRFTHQRLEMKLCSCEEIKRNTPGSQFSPKSKKDQILHYLYFWYKFRFFLHCALFVCAFLCIALFFITINNFIPQIL